MVTQCARGVVDFNQPTSEFQGVNWTNHDACCTTKTPIIVHLEQVSNGRHERHDGVLVHGFLVNPYDLGSIGWNIRRLPKEIAVLNETPTFPLEHKMCSYDSEEVERKMSNRRCHWRI